MPRAFDIAAYYWPAYHDEPRWRRFMPSGEGEWEIIRKATPKFGGHEQPRVPAWGYTNEADPREMARKIDAAADHGVNVFIFDWYWYENQPFLEAAVNEGFLGAANNHRIQFYLMWANHDATTLWDLERSATIKPIWTGRQDRRSFDAIVDRFIDRYFHHSSYYRIDGRPVLAIYELSSLIRGMGGLARTRAALASFREKVVDAGFPGLHLQAMLWGAIPATRPGLFGGPRTMNHTIETLGIDSLTTYQWCHHVRPRGPYIEWAERAMQAWDRWSDEFSVPFFPHVSIGWDTNPRFKTFKEDLVTGSTPALFKACLLRAMRHISARGLSPPLVTVNSWNEWSEGSYLEPDTRHGTGYLEAVRDAIDEFPSTPGG